jgi:hypothetical protein
MSVAVDLHIPHLWIDRYCIDQTNIKEKHDIIRNMDKIYKGAQLPIVATVGDNPHHVLPGIGGTPQKAQPFLEGKKTQYISVGTLHEDIRKSKWYSRGCEYIGIP